MKTTPTRNKNYYENKPRPFPYSKDIQGYQKAVWDFLLEHSEVQDSGALFIKFHTSGKDNFEKRVLSRWHYGYHRENVEEKEQKHQDLRKIHTERKIEKELRWETYKEQKRRAYKRKVRKEKIKKALQPLIRIVRTLLGKKDPSPVLQEQEKSTR